MYDIILLIKYRLNDISIGQQIECLNIIINNIILIHNIYIYTCIIRKL